MDRPLVHEAPKAAPIASTKADKPVDVRLDGNRFRRKRFRLLLDLLDAQAGMGRPIRILDIGGTRSYWEAMRDLWQHLPLEITIVNLGATSNDDPPFHIREGNACAMPRYATDSFDVVHSNSVIEHVGHWAEMSAMAGEVRRLARTYFVQTPAHEFPFEPHYRTAFFHWYSQTTRARMLMRKKRGFRGPLADFDTAMHNVQSVNLLTATQLHALFPDAMLERESFFGLTKSHVAIRKDGR